MSELYEIANAKRSTSSYNYITEKYSNNVQNSASNNHKYALKALVNMIERSQNMALKEKSLCWDENFLYRFLYASKFSCERAINLLIKYLIYKQNNKDVLKNLNIFDKAIQMALCDGNPGIIAERDRRGRKVLTFTAANWNTSKYSLLDVYRAFLLTLDKLLEDMQNQALGFVIIVDWTNFTYKQSTHLTPKILKLMITGLQDCMPIKFKGIHFISQPWYVDLALTAIRPMFDDKIKRRLHCHGSNLTSLHAQLTKDILPPELGGEAANINYLDWYHSLVDSSQNSEAPKTYRLIETLVYSKSPTDAKSNY